MVNRVATLAAAPLAAFFAVPFASAKLFGTSARSRARVA
jgi:hypothetical protein